jgi:hypothetical protein
VLEQDVTQQVCPFRDARYRPRVITTAYKPSPILSSTTVRAIASVAWPRSNRLLEVSHVLGNAQFFRSNKAVRVMRDDHAIIAGASDAV